MGVNARSLGLACFCNGIRHHPRQHRENSFQLFSFALLKLNAGTDGCANTKAHAMGCIGSFCLVPRIALNPIRRTLTLTSHVEGVFMVPDILFSGGVLNGET